MSTKKVKKNFQLNSFEIQPIIDAHSRSRFIKYIDACNGDDRKAFRLYSWNIAVGNAFFALLLSVEVILRNSINDALANYYKVEDWFARDDLNFDDGAKRKIKDAKKKLGIKENEPFNSNSLIAEITFGYWTDLLSNRYEMTLWRPALRKIFFNVEKLTREEAYVLLKSQRQLRNRIAHHNIIFDRNLEQDYKDILKVIGWMSPDSEKWVSSVSRIPMLLANRNGTDIIKF